MRAKKLLGFFILLFLFVNYAYSISVEISIDEDAKLTKLVSEKYTLSAKGTLTIYNPSNVSKVYEAYFPLELDSLIGINKIDIDNSSSKFTFSYNNIKGYLIGPNETIKVGYNIFGILDYNIYQRLENQNQTVFEYYVSDYNLVSNIVLNLRKPLREGYIQNISQDYVQTPNESSTSRLVSAQIRNPTDFDIVIDNLKLYRTHVGDPMFRDGTIIKIYQNISLNPFDYKEVNFFDLLSDETSVYWMSTDLHINYLFKSKSKKTYNNELRPQVPGAGGTGSVGGGGGAIIIDDNKIKDSIFIKKEADKTFLKNGEEFEVKLRIVNVNSIRIENLTIYDQIPTGYEIKEVSHNVKILNGQLIFQINGVDSYETLLIKYTLVPKTDFKGITYLKPAQLLFDNNLYYSEGILIINDFLPNEKVFVQKEIRYIDDDFAQITIIVKNLGNYILEDILISDEIPQDAIIKEISKIFYDRGVWKIKSLKPGEEWSVTFKVSRNSKLDTIPNIFGIEKSEVYGTLVFSEEITTIFQEQPRIIEKVGMSLAVGFLIIYLLF